MHACASSTGGPASTYLRNQFLEKENMCTDTSTLPVTISSYKV